MQANGNDLDISYSASERMIVNMVTGDENSLFPPGALWQAFAETSILGQVASMVRSFQRDLSTAIHSSNAFVVEALIEVENEDTSMPIEYWHLGNGRVIGEDLCNSDYIRDRRTAMQKVNYGDEVMRRLRCLQRPQEFTSSAQCKRDAFDKFVQRCIFLSRYPALDSDPTMMPHEIAYGQLTRLFSNVSHDLMGQPAVSLLRRARAEYAAIGRVERRRANGRIEVPSKVASVPSFPALLEDNVEPRKNPNEILHRDTPHSGS